MKWKQRFKRSRKNTTFSEDDLKTAKSWRRCAVGDKLHSMGYNLSLTSEKLGSIVIKLDKDLAKMGYSFTESVSISAGLLRYREEYMDDNRRNDYLYYINTAQETYDEIQKTEPTQALINELHLKATPVTA